MKKLGVVAALCVIPLASAGSVASVLPNDFLQGAFVEVSAAPTDLYACVMAAASGIDGISTETLSHDADGTVSFGTLMPRVNGHVQRRSGGRVIVIISMLSQEDEPAVKAFATPRAEAIAAAIAEKCGGR